MVWEKKKKSAFTVLVLKQSEYTLVLFLNNNGAISHSMSI